MDLFLEKAGGIFDLMFDAVSEGIIVIDPQQRIVKSNQAASNMFGYRSEELLGQPLDILIPKNYRSSHSKNVEKFVHEKKARKMGQGRWLGK